VQTERRWINQTHPQTLLLGVYLLYLDALFAVVFGLINKTIDPITAVIAAGSVAAGYGIANDRRPAWYGGIVVSVIGVLLILATGFILSINLLFAVAQVALLVHPMSRNYVKTWFR
jgi:hypothetical protein